MRFARWITKATDTHPEYIILIVFPLQQWLRERVSKLRFTHTACLVRLSQRCICVLLLSYVTTLRVDHCLAFRDGYCLDCRPTKVRTLYRLETADSSRPLMQLNVPENVELTERLIFLRMLERGPSTCGPEISHYRMGPCDDFSRSFQADSG